MFSALIARIRRSVSSTVGSVLGRIAVGVLFLIAAAFALAALTLALVDRFGAQAAYWILAGGFALIGAMAIVILSAREEEQAEIAQHEAEASSAVSSMFTPENTLAAATALAPMLLSSSNASTALRGARLAVRNMPLVVLALLVLVLTWPFEKMHTAGGRSAPPRTPPRPG